MTRFLDVTGLNQLFSYLRPLLKTQERKIYFLLLKGLTRCLSKQVRIGKSLQSLGQSLLIPILVIASTHIYLGCLKYNRGGRNAIQEAKETLGHNSIVNTSLYISLANHNLNITVLELIKKLGTKVDDEAAGTVKYLLDESGMVNQKTKELYDEFNTVPELRDVDGNPLVDNPLDADWFVKEDDPLLATHNTHKELGGPGKLNKRQATKLELMGITEINPFSDIPFIKFTRKGFADPLKLDIQESIYKARQAIIEAAIDKSVTHDPTIFISKIQGRGSKAAQKSIGEALNGLDGVSILYASLQTASREAQLIKTSKEVMDKSSKKLAADEANIYTQIGKKARDQEAFIEGWYEPLLRVKDLYLTQLEEGSRIVGRQADTQIKVDYDHHVALINARFTDLDTHVLTRDIELKHRGTGGRQVAPAHASLHAIPIFYDLHLIAQAIPGKIRKGSKIDQADTAWNNMTLAERKAKWAADAKGDGRGYIIAPGKKAGMYRGLNVKDHYYVVGYIMKDGKYFDHTLHDPANITHIEAQKLASAYKDGNKIVLAQGKKAITTKIELLEWEHWSISSSRKLGPHMIRAAATGKSGALTSESVLAAIMHYGGDGTGQKSMREMRAMTGPKGAEEGHYSVDRLKKNEHLVKVSGEGHDAIWEWSDAIRAGWAQEGGEKSTRWGSYLKNKPGADDVGGRQPPRDPETPTSAPLPGDEFSKATEEFGARQENGKWQSIGQTVTVPRGMDQKMRFAGDSFRKSFYSFYSRFPSKFRKFTRFFVPQTFAASHAAKLRWTYIMSKSEGQEVSSNIGHMLDKIHDVFGTNRRNGRGTKVRLKGGVGVNPRNGKLNDGGLLENDDYFRFEGVKKSGKNAAEVEMRPDMYGPGQAPERRFHLVGEQDQVWGPIAEMEQRFIAFQKNDPILWDNARIIRERKKFNHLEVMQDLTTVLNTSRTDLFRYYELTAEQLKWYDNFHQVGPHLVDMLRKAGMDVDSKKSILGKAAGEFRSSFVPSLFLEQTSDIRVGFAGTTQMGAKPSQMMPHKYYWQISDKMDQGQAAGKIKHDLYNTDPVLATQRQAESYYDYVATERFMDDFANLGILNRETGTANNILNMIVEARGDYSKWTDPQRMAAAKFFGPKWRDMSPGMITKERARIAEISANWKNLELRDVQRKGVVKQHPLYKTALPPEASKELAALISDEFTKASAFLTVPSAIANTMRVLATGADLGVMLLHGLGGIGMMTSPNVFMPMGQRFAWAKGSYNMGKAMWSPRVRTEWYTRTMATRKDMQKYGVAFFRSTHIEDLPLPGLFTKGRGRPTQRKLGLKQGERAIELAWTVPERMMSGFGFFLDVSKTEMWKVQQKMIRQHFGAIDNAGQALTTQTPQQLEDMEAAFNDMAASLNAIHGTLQPAAVGIPSKQRNFESAFLLYAALYRRSAVAVMKNLMSTSKWRRNMALESVSGMLLAGGSIAWAIKSAGLNDDVLDPGSADFMSIKVGGMRIGIGTPFYSFMRMGKDVMDQMVDDPQGLAEVNFSDNSLLKWARSGSSPITSIGIDLAMGQDFIGDPLRDTTGGWEVNKIGDRISRSLMPFWLDTIQDSVWGSKDMPPAAGLAEFFGLRTSPQSAYGRLKAARNTAILMDEDPELMKWKREQERLGRPIDGDTIPKLLLKQLKDRHPALQDLEVEMAEDVERRGSYIRKRQDEYISLTKLNMKGRGPAFSEFNPTANDEPIGLEIRLQGLELKFVNHEITGRELREQWTLIETEHRGRNQELAEAFKDVIDTFNERRVGEENNAVDKFVYDHWYDRYRQEVTGSEALHDIYGNFDSDEFKRRQEKFELHMVTNYGKESWQYIQDMKKHGKILPPSLKRLADAREKELGEFWDLPDRYFSPGVADLIHHWRGARTREAKAWFQTRHPQIKRILRVLRKLQDRYRMANPIVDALLVEFYDYAALTRAGKLIERARLIAAAGRPTRPVQQVSDYQVNPEMIFQEPVGAA